MNMTLVESGTAAAKADALVLAVYEGQLAADDEAPSAWMAMERDVRTKLQAVLAQEGFTGKAEQTAALATLGEAPYGRILAVGLGSRAKATHETLRLAAGRAIKAANRLKLSSLAFELPGGLESADAVRAAVEGLELGAYRYDRWRTTNKEEKAAPRVAKVALVLPDGVEKDAPLLAALELGRKVAQATNFARDLVNEPAGTMTPTILADEARKMAKAAGLSIEVKEKKDIEGLNMGMFLGVTKGSEEPPKLIHLAYVPKKPAHAKRAPVCLVGKAITFDSGGLSLKPSDGMLDMKTDMAGSAAVLGAMMVIAHLKPPFPVHAFMGACENMPSGSAYRLGDVLVSRLGKTVEITNTDAEGRLVLGDMLAYANELKPAAIIDLATLTGACIIALGNNHAGCFGDDEHLVHEVLESARHAGEDLWRLPVTEYLRDVLKSEVADLKNAGDRAGGASSAALFLKEFVGSTPWVHLDIAGPSSTSKERGYIGKGGTGMGVRTLVEYVRRRSGMLESA